jgi:hypothetical protein
LFNKLVTQESFQKIQMDGVHRIGKGGSQWLMDTDNG